MTAVQSSNKQNSWPTHERQQISEMPKRRRFNLWRWVSLVVGILVVLVIIEFLLSPGWEWDLIASYMFDEEIVAAVGRTLLLTVTSLTTGLAIGLLVCGARLSRFLILRILAIAYIWVVRAVPLMVILLFLFFLGDLLPTLGIGIPWLPPFFEIQTNDIVTNFGAATLGLGLYLGGKAAEIFRGGYMAVSPQQHEAVRALGLKPTTAFLRITGPQAFRVAVPTIANEVVTMFKNTSIVTVIGYGELLTTVRRIYSATGETVPMLTVAVLWYLGFTSLLMIGQIWIERRMGRSY